MKIWDISIRQPVFMTMVLIAGIVMGVFSYFRMPVDNFPNVEFPIVVVTTIYPGASPTEVQDNVTELLEDEAEQLWWNRQVVDRTHARPKRLAQAGECCWIAIVSVDIGERPQQV